MVQCHTMAQRCEEEWIQRVEKKQMAKEPSELLGMTKTFFTIIWAHSSATALHSNTILRELKRLMHYSDFSPPRVCNFCQRLRRRRAGLSGNTQCSYNNCLAFVLLSCGCSDHSQQWAGPEQVPLRLIVPAGTRERGAARPRLCIKPADFPPQLSANQGIPSRFLV